jgi:hypothetical protein
MAMAAAKIGNQASGVASGEENGQLAAAWRSATAYQPRSISLAIMASAAWRRNMWQLKMAVALNGGGSEMKYGVKEAYRASIVANHLAASESVAYVAAVINTANPASAGSQQWHRNGGQPIM